jgi:hypothetical protein
MPCAPDERKGSRKQWALCSGARLACVQVLQLSVIVGDIETVFDFKRFAAVNDHDGKGDDEILAPWVTSSPSTSAAGCLHRCLAALGACFEKALISYSLIASLACRHNSSRFTRSGDAS